MAIDLIKLKERRDTVINLKKDKGLELVNAQVVLTVDYSGSMGSLYSNGTVQDTVERILPLGLAFDVDKSVEAYLFHDGVIKLSAPITQKNLDGYVNEQTKGKSMGGTNYAPIINQIVADHGSTKKSGFLGLGGSKPTTMEIPVYVIFITDGECMDKSDARQAIIEASRHGIFFQFIGIGNEQFKFLQELDDLEGRTVDNADFFKIKNLKEITDNQLYQMLMTEFPSWIKLAKQHSLIS